jgi:membrane-associated phospholipid phosphatase
VFADPIHLRPFENDLLIARACAQIATPTIERSLNFLTSLADERAMLVIAAAVWLASRYCKRGEDREEADTMLASVLIAGAMPDLFKLLVRRRRPDRTIRGRRNGIPYSGDAWDSFPSGHAIHLGAMAPSAARLVPRSLRQIVWPTVFCLASTRTLILAHYPSDVLAGLGIGLATNKAIRAALGRWRISRLAARIGHKESKNLVEGIDALYESANGRTQRADRRKHASTGSRGQKKKSPRRGPISKRIHELSA